MLTLQQNFKIDAETTPSNVAIWNEFSEQHSIKKAPYLMPD